MNDIQTTRVKSRKTNKCEYNFELKIQNIKECVDEASQHNRNTNST